MWVWISFAVVAAVVRVTVGRHVENEAMSFTFIRQRKFAPEVDGCNRSASVPGPWLPV